ncbi:MAG TPA: lytic transglycosylase domain-containing protein [Terriglobales bacterium]|nr:lytic transglycosylase domain-containing protein [Terriglobales bacterium]
MSKYGKRILLFATLMMATGALAQSSSAVEEQFADLTQSLSGTADRLLTAASAHDAAVPNPVASTAILPQPAEALGLMARSRRWQELRQQIEPILKAQGLPIEVLAVVKVESGGQPDALSRAGARGLWQLMPDTARRYGLIVDGATDERLDPEKATWAATQYLRELLELFGDWRLALAAYNAGEDAVSRAITRSGSREFEVLRLKRVLPEETRKYVPAVLAVMRQLGSVGEPKLPEPITRVSLDNSARVYASTDAGD